MTPFEKRVEEKFIADGWKVLRNGWPDFLLVREKPDGTKEIKAVEVKSKNDKLRSNQGSIIEALLPVMRVDIALEGLYTDTIDVIDLRLTQE